MAWKICPKCGGSGYTKNWPTTDSDYPCKECNTTGKIQCLSPAEERKRLEEQKARRKQQRRQLQKEERRVSALRWELGHIPKSCKIARKSLRIELGISKATVKNLLAELAKKPGKPE